MLVDLPASRRRALRIRCCVVIALWAAPIVCARAEDSIDGFLAPFRSVEVATAETGILRRMLVREGEQVTAGQVLAQLDDEVHSAVMAEAERGARSLGRLEAARAEQQLRQQRLTALETLMSRGNARPEEVWRAKGDLEIAAAQLRSMQDELDVKQLEFERTQRMWERRKVCAPSDGVVVRLGKKEGEFVGPNDPHLVTLMQLDPLLATFAVPSGAARGLRTGQVVSVRLPESNRQVEGTIHLISPVIEGKSGTMRVEVRIDNLNREFLSGEACSLLLSGESDFVAAPERK